MIKERSRAMSELFRSYTTYEGLIGKTVICSVCELATDKTHRAAHTKEYVQVLLPETTPLGSMVKATITNTAGKFSVFGKVEDILFKHEEILFGNKNKNEKETEIEIKKK